MCESIQQISKRYDVSVATLRYYDKIGLLPRLTRDNSGYRQFTKDDCSDLEMVICFRNLGVGVKEIAAVMAPVTNVNTRSRKLSLIEKQKNRLLVQAVNIQMGLLMIAIKQQIYQNPEVPSKQHARQVIRDYVEKKLLSTAPENALEMTLANDENNDWFATADRPLISRAIRLYMTVQD